MAEKNYDAQRVAQLTAGYGPLLTPALRVALPWLSIRPDTPCCVLVMDHRTPADPTTTANTIEQDLERIGRTVVGEYRSDGEVAPLCRESPLWQGALLAAAHRRPEYGDESTIAALIEAAGWTDRVGGYNPPLDLLGFFAPPPTWGTAHLAIATVGWPQPAADLAARMMGDLIGCSLGLNAIERTDLG